MKTISILLIFSFIISAQSALTDRGSIPFRPDVKVFEPKQRAIIAWDGTEEILLLSTDLRASEPSKVLEVIPLPSEPNVKKGDIETFKRATSIINKKLPTMHAYKEGRRGEIGAPAPPAGEVTFYKRIGAHDISVTHVLNSAGFIEWVEDYLKSEGVDNPSIPEKMKSVVEEYLRDDFPWFVFDIVSLDNAPMTNDAIQYRFKSDCLYYPLRITRTEEGFTDIDLIVLTPKLLSEFPGIPINQVNLEHEPVTISSQELKDINKEMYDLLGHLEQMKLRIWKISGWLSSFEYDLIARE